MKEKNVRRENMVELRNLKIDKVAFHQIFKRINKEEIVDPYYNNSCEVLTEQIKNTLQNRMVKAFGNDSHCLKMDIGDTGEESVYNKICQYWNSETNEQRFLNLSKDLTKSLAVAQDTKQYTGGIVIIIEGTVSRNDNRYVAIIKADIHDGMNIKDVDGVKELDYIDNLLLTPAQKMQKIGLFIDKSTRANRIDSDELDTYIYDINTDRNSTLKKAEYFYNRFLGLKMSSNNDVMTNSFYRYTREFINEQEMLPSSEKNRLQTQLINYMNYTGNIVLNVGEFAEENFAEEEMQDDYIRFMSSNSMPEHSITKDMSLVKINKRNLEFENKIKLQAPTEAFARNVEIEEDEEGNTIVKIRGKLIRE